MDWVVNQPALVFGGDKEQKQALFHAMSQVFAKMVDVAKDAKNPMFDSKYADLTAVLNAARPILAEFNLYVLQSPRMTDKMVHVQTMIAHADGGYITDTASHERSGNQEANDLQKLGTVITYLRRYALKAMLAIGDKDDDGASIGKPAKTTRKPRAKGELQKSKRDDYSTAGSILAETIVSTFTITDPEKAKHFVSGLLGQKVDDLIEVFKSEEMSSKAGAKVDELVASGRTLESIVSEYTMENLF
jgi:hypothetical protein